MNLLKRVRPWLLLLLIPVLFAGISQPASAEQIAFPPPTITSLTYSSGLIKLTWSMKAGYEEEAEYYRVYRSVNGGSFSKVAQLSGSGSTYYQSGDAQPGSTYTFKVMAGCHYGISGDSDPRSVSIPLSAPNITSAMYSSGIIQLKWNSVAGASYYEVYRSINGGSFSKLKKNSSGTTYEYNDVSSGNRYSFKVQAVSGHITSPFSNTRDVTVPLAAPTITGLAFIDDTITVTWGAVQGATGYQLNCSVNGEPSTQVADTAGTTFAYKGASPGNTYSFKVRATNKYTKGPFSPAKSITGPLTAPEITSLTLKDDTITVTWSAVQGATGYQLNCSVNGEPSTQVADTAGTTFAYKGASSGSTYSFKVRATTKHTKGPFSPVKSITGPLTAPEITSLTLKDDTIIVTWGAVQGATGYQLNCSVNGKPSTPVAADTAGTSFAYKGAIPGSMYSFKVRATNQHTKGPFSLAKSIVVPLTAPEITEIAEGGPSATFSWGTPSVSLTSDGQMKIDTGLSVDLGGAPGSINLYVQWTAVPGASEYELFCAVNDEPSTLVETTEKTTCVYKGAQAGSMYSFQVRAVSKYAKGPFSEISHFSVPLATPSILRAYIDKNFLSILWSPVNGATKYEVWQSVNDGQWAFLASIENDTMYSSSHIQTGNKYSYAIWALNKYAVSEFSDPVLLYALAQPSDLEVELTPEANARITWAPVPGATEYHVFKKVNNAHFYQLLSTVNPNVLDSNLNLGNTYTYKVRAYTYNSYSWDSAEASITLPALQAPTITDFYQYGDEIIVRWDKVEYAHGGYTIAFSVNGMPFALYRIVSSNQLGITEYDPSFLGENLKVRVTAISGDSQSASTESSKMVHMILKPVITELSVSGRQVTIRWDDLEKKEGKWTTRYELKRNGETIATLDGKTYSYIDTVNGPGTYKYKLFAHRFDTSSGYTWIDFTVTVP